MSFINKIRSKVKSIRVDRELSSLQKRKVQRKRDELRLEDLKLQAKIAKQRASIAKSNSKISGGGSRFGAAKVLKNMERTNKNMFSSSNNNDPLSLGDKKFPPL